MLYPLLPIGLVAVFVVAVLYLLLVKKDMKKMKSVLYPGLAFIAVWGVIYFLWMR